MLRAHSFRVGGVVKTIKVIADCDGCGAGSGSLIRIAPDAEHAQETIVAALSGDISVELPAGWTGNAARQLCPRCSAPPEAA